MQYNITYDIRSFFPSFSYSLEHNDVIVDLAICCSHLIKKNFRAAGIAQMVVALGSITSTKK
jgi:hypothetical protein